MSAATRRKKVDVVVSMIIPEITSRYLSLGEIFRASLHILKLRYLAILGIVLAFHAPIDVLLSFLPYDENIFLIAGAGLVATILRLPVPIFIALVVEGWMNGETVPGSEALRRAIAKWMDATWVHIFQFLAVALGCVLLIAPGIIIAVYLLFSIQVVALRGETGKDALGYSYSLVGWQWWRVFGVALAIFLFAGVPAIAAYGLWDGPENPAIVRMIPPAVSYVLSSFSMVAMTTFFLNMDYLKNAPTEEEPDGG